MSLILSIWTVVAFLMFIGISLWAWNSGNKKEFEEAARIPFEEDEIPEINKESHDG